MQQPNNAPPRQRRPPPPLGTQSVDGYGQNNVRVQYNQQYNNNVPYSGSVSYQNQNQGHYDNNHLQFPNNSRHQRMNSSSGGISPPPQHINSYPVNNYPQQQPQQGFPKYSSTVPSSAYGRGPQTYSVNNSVPVQNYGQPPNQRMYQNNQELTPEIYVQTSEHNLPNPPRKYIPAGVTNVPPTPRRQVISPNSNHKVGPNQISPVRSNASSSPQLSPQLVGSHSPKPPPRRSFILPDSSGSPPNRYAHPSYSPGLDYQLPPPPRQYQRGRNTSMSSQNIQVPVNQTQNANSPNSFASSVNNYHSPSLHEDSGVYSPHHQHKRNYSYSSSITVPNMELNEGNDDGYYFDHRNSLMVNVNGNNIGARQSLASQVSGISQLSSMSKSTYNNSDHKEIYYEGDSSDENIEEAAVNRNDNRSIIEAEDDLQDAGSSLIYDEKTLAENTEKVYENLDPSEAKELQRLSINLKNFDANNNIKFDDFNLDSINDESDKNKKISDKEQNSLSIIKGDVDILNLSNISDELDRSNQALLNVLSDEIKDLFNQVDINDSKGRPSDNSSKNPLERVKQNDKIERSDTGLSTDSLQMTDVFTHLSSKYNDDGEITPKSTSSNEINNNNNNQSFINESISYDNSLHEYQYEEDPSISYRRNSFNSNNGSVYNGDEKSFGTFISVDNNSIRQDYYNPSQSIQDNHGPAPSLDAEMSDVPPKRPPRYYEINNQGPPPAVPPRRHYRASVYVDGNSVEVSPSVKSSNTSSLSKPERRQSLGSKIVLQTPPRSGTSQPANRVPQSPDEESVVKSNTTKTSTIPDDAPKEDEFEDDFVYHSGDIREKFPLVNHSACMSQIAANFRKRIKLVTHIKDSIEYMQSFSGYDAVTALAEILETEDRKVAQTTGQALEEQGMFHDVVYLHKLLDSHYHYYQFEDLAKPIAILERKETERLNPKERANLMRKITERRGSRAELDENEPLGVLVNIAKCYSPTCTDSSPCYSYSCPRRRIKEKVTIEETGGRYANMNMTLGLQTTWSTSLGKSYVSKMSKQAIKRQEIMYEFIRTEKEYVNDLQSVIKYMIDPLRHGKVIGVDSRLIDSIFGNIEEISKVNSDFYEKLRKLQKRKPVLESMGDVVKECVSSFICYTKYGENQPSAKQILQVQKNKNIQLNAFFKECQNMPYFRRLPVESFLARPTTRLGRYPILIRDILKNTSKNHRDQILLKEANTTIENILKEVNALAGKETNRLKMNQWSELLRFEKKNDVSSIHFDDPKREYIREGKLSLIVPSFANDPLEVILLLLDNSLIITYEKNNSFHIYGKPIPINLLSISHSEQKRSLKPGESHSSSKKLVVNNHSKSGGIDSMGYIFSVKHLGVLPTYNFFTPILSEQKAWVEAIQKQQSLLPKPIVKEVIFFSHTKLESPVQTIHRLKNGALLLANDIGLYVLINNAMMKPLLQLSKITQIEALETFDILFILANREVYSFSIDLILKGIYTNPSYIKHNKKISSNVSFIATGYCDEKFLLCCAKASTNKTVVKMFEPKRMLSNISNRKACQKLYISGDVITSFKQFYIPSEGVNIRFLRRSLCVACIKSFEVVSIKNLTTQSLLNPNDIVFKNLLKSEYSPMNMFKTQHNDFLLCYNKIGFFIDKNGNRSRPNLFFKWNASPKSFAYRSPYIYIITSEYIAIWNEFDSKEAKQIIPGNHLKLLLHDDNQNLIYSKIEDSKQRIATIEIIKPPPTVIQTQMQFPPPQIKN